MTIALLRRIATALALAAAGSLAAGMAASPRDGATIVDSGSTNAPGYTMHVWSDGSASVTVGGRGAAAPAAAKPFTVPSAVTARFFSDLKAARNGKVTGAPCMKSASFGTTTRITWHGWTSPDLDCPPQGALMIALVRDVGAIHGASGINIAPGRRMLPVQQPSPAPS